MPLRTSSGRSGRSHGRKNPAGFPSRVTRRTSCERIISVARSRKSRSVTTFTWSPLWPQFYLGTTVVAIPERRVESEAPCLRLPAAEVHLELFTHERLSARHWLGSWG